MIVGYCACPEILLRGVGGFRVRFLFVAVLGCDDLLPYVLAMHALLGNAGVQLVLLQLDCRIHVLYVEWPRRTLLALHGILLKVALISALVSGLHKFDRDSLHLGNIHASFLKLASFCVGLADLWGVLVVD